MPSRAGLRIRRCSPSRAVWSLRVAAGTALIVVGVVEKLANPELARQFLADHPSLSVAAQVGSGWSDLEVVRVVGAIEVLFGLLLCPVAAR